MRIYLVLIIFLLTSNLLAQKPSTNIHFTPNTYFRNYSIQNQPVLRIQPGDTVTTESVDAGGFDKHGKKVTERGNPLTGPFYIQNAEPGDIIAIHIISVKLNRDFATTLNTLIPKMQDKKVAMKNWKSAKLVRWYLDTINLIAKPDSQFIKLKNVSLPLHPFLGCVGVASTGEKGMSSGGSDYTGGNLDFKFITTGSTIYLPVIHAGGYLYLGDGHAAQGDGELNGDALETSMSFSFSVRIIKKENTFLPVPSVENDKYWMIFGIEDNLDKAMKAATKRMAEWLKKEYSLNDAEVSQVIGPAIEYRIAKVAASKVEVVAILPKNIISTLMAIRRTGAPN